MPSIRRQSHVPYTAEQMFALVNDIDAYPQFLEWCTGAQILRRGDHFIEATLRIGFAGFQKSFTTRNTLEAPTRIGVSLVSGPFKRLEGEWHFNPTDDGGCTTELSLDFEVTPSPLSMIMSSVFEEVARSQMNAFLKRAHDIYGQRNE